MRTISDRGIVQFLELDFKNKHHHRRTCLCLCVLTVYTVYPFGLPFLQLFSKILENFNLP